MESAASHVSRTTNRTAEEQVGLIYFVIKSAGKCTQWYQPTTALLRSVVRDEIKYMHSFSP